jgi:hypothetical protein
MSAREGLRDLSPAALLHDRAAIDPLIPSRRRARRGARRGPEDATLPDAWGSPPPRDTGLLVRCYASCAHRSEGVDRVLSTWADPGY